MKFSRYPLQTMMLCRPENQFQSHRAASYSHIHKTITIISTLSTDYGVTDTVRSKSSLEQFFMGKNGNH